MVLSCVSTLSSEYLHYTIICGYNLPFPGPFLGSASPPLVQRARIASHYRNLRSYPTQALLRCFRRLLKLNICPTKRNTMRILCPSACSEFVRNYCVRHERNQLCAATSSLRIFHPSTSYMLMRSECDDAVLPPRLEHHLFTQNRNAA